MEKILFLSNCIPTFGYMVSSFMLTIARQQNTEKEEAAVFLSPKILSQIERTNVEVKIENLFLSTKNNFKKSPGGSG